MVNISNFRGSSKKNAEKRNFELIKILNNFCKNKDYIKIIKFISLKLDVPEKYLLIDTKIYLHRNYSTRKMKFNNIFSLKYLPISILYYFAFFIYIFIFSSKKKINKIETDLLIDEIYNKRDAEKFKVLKKFFKKSIFIVYKKFNISYPNYKFLNYQKLNRNILFNKVPTLIFPLLLNSIVLSLKQKINIINILIFLISQIFKYKNIFANVRAKYLIQDRHFGTSSIKSYLFKKNGGKSYSVTQKLIPQLMGPGSFAYADIFFALGKKSHQRAIMSSGNFKKVIPVGSFFMENIYFQNKNEKKIKYDLVNIISDGPHFSDGYKDYYKNWVEHLNWLKKLSLEDKDLKIIIKRRPGDKLDKNNFLINFFKNSKVDIVLGDTALNQEYSYEHCMRSKVVCTWSSTLGYELIGHNKPCIYMDPGGKNLSFVPSDKMHASIKAVNYRQFKKKFYTCKNYKNYFFKDISREDFCLKSNNVSKRIFKNLKEHTFKH